MKKSLLRRLALWIVPPLGILVIWLLYLTNRRIWHIEAQGVPHTPFVALLWHGELLMAPFVFRKVAPKMRLNVLISEHFDGEMIRRIVAPFGILAIRGSTRKGAAKALIGAIRKVKKGESVAITPDGPKGPRHSIADGAIVIAQKTGTPIVLFNCRPRRYWQLKSWDRFVIPKPFGTIEYFASKPIDVTGMGLEEAKEFIRNRMLEHAV